MHRFGEFRRRVWQVDVGVRWRPKHAEARYVHTAWTSRRLGAFRETMSLTIILEQSFLSAVTSITSEHPHEPISPCPGRVSYEGVACLQSLCASSRRHNLGGICSHLTDASLAYKARNLRLLASSQSGLSVHACSQ